MVTYLPLPLGVGQGEDALGGTVFEFSITIRRDVALAAFRQPQRNKGGIASTYSADTSNVKYFSTVQAANEVNRAGSQFP